MIRVVTHLPWCLHFLVCRSLNDHYLLAPAVLPGALLFPGVLEGVELLPCLIQLELGLAHAASPRHCQLSPL